MGEWLNGWMVERLKGAPPPPPPPSLADGAEQVSTGGGARALGMANMNVSIKSDMSRARLVGVLTTSSKKGAAAKGPAPNASLMAWHACTGCGNVTARRVSVPYRGTRAAAAAAREANRLATARRSTLAAAARASANRRTAAQDHMILFLTKYSWQKICQ